MSLYLEEKTNNFVELHTKGEKNKTKQNPKLTGLEMKVSVKLILLSFQPF